jgi:hypothetical protein
MTSSVQAGVPAIIEETTESIEQTIEEINESYEQCEALYEQIRNSKCASSIFGIFGRMYLKLGFSWTERQVKFSEKDDAEQAVFRLTSGFKPRPIFSVALEDSYFTESNWGYGFGFSYFDDYAFEQQIKRGSGSEDVLTVDLGTYSSMNIIALTPSVFYSWGRGDSTPNRYLKMGMGLNLMYSAVRGTAFLTEDESDASCYDLGTQIVVGTSNDLDGLRSLCATTRFRESSYGTGVKIFIAGEWNKWESEISFSAYNHRSVGDYRFVTQEVQLAFSRKFSF